MQGQRSGQINATINARHISVGPKFMMMLLYLENEARRNNNMKQCIDDKGDNDSF